MRKEWTQKRTERQRRRRVGAVEREGPIDVVRAAEFESAIPVVFRCFRIYDRTVWLGYPRVPGNVTSLGPPRSGGWAPCLAGTYSEACA